MKKSIILTIMFSLFIFTTGCGTKVEESKTESNQTQAKAEVLADIAPNPADSLAGKSFPIRSNDNAIVTIETDYGKMIVELYRDVAPAHADSFVARTNDGFYNGIIFHRIIDNFMIQGGDPQGTGTGNAGYFLPAEFNELPHQDGTLSMARGQSPNSASCQFFVCLARTRSTAGLDRQYTVFGQLIKGYNVLHAIGSLPVTPNARGEKSVPVDEVVMRKVYLSDAEGNALN